METIEEARRRYGLLNGGSFGWYKGKRLFFSHSKPGQSYTEDMLFSISGVGKIGMWIDNYKIAFE